MFRTALMLATAAAIALTATSGAFAKPKAGFTISDTSGKVIFDDGVPDGRGCVVGTRAIWVPSLGTFVKIPASKCNF